MGTRSHSTISIIEAVETLSSIADLELDKEMGIVQKHEITLDNEPVTYKTVHWLHARDASSTVLMVKEIFRIILNYLRQFYRKEYGYVTDSKTIEGIKTIMVLVGEAAKKLDKYTSLFHQTHQQSVTELKEYKRLQDFYLSKIARKIDEGVLSKWVLGLSLGKMKIPASTPPFLKGATVSEPERARMEDETKHIFVDLETVKKDIEYELFFIRKEDGTRFFNPRLIRNIKLICDFGEYFGKPKGEDPLTHMQLWLDRFYNESSKNILQFLGDRLKYFFKEIRKVKDHEVVEGLNKALIALLLSSHMGNLSGQHPSMKTCTEYFEDFQVFLRETLNTRTYQKWIAYPPKESNGIAESLLDIIHTLCGALYTHLKGLNEMVSIIHLLINESQQGVSLEHEKEALISKKVWNAMASNYAAMNKFMKKHPHGPLLKVLSTLEGKVFNTFDPLLQHNLPNQLYGLQLKEDHLIENFRFPAPVHQEFIHKAVVVEEFKGFLRDYKKLKKKHLLINLQDSTSWVEQARCAALEELQDNPDVNEAIEVVTLAVDTDFYHQLSPYHQINHADTFIKQFKEHLKGEGSGFSYPASINQETLHLFIDRAVNFVHRVFFSSKNVLLREHRLDFIEILYLFLELKLIDMIKPDSFSLTCKDGIDISLTYSAELFILLKFINAPEWSDHEIDYLNALLYAPPLLIRDRILLPERFNRMVSAIRTVENTQWEYGKENFPKLVQEAFFDMFENSILSSKIQLPTG